ncbi:uncharacterized protein LOC111714466 [Eurytemora carolleeae]|uniref:uncharacterized protein LOC111714466 n=1 Tax=Eurytemora carolleeae TaxID=1294199 RepID=UPI000C756462|nr:uncharacterized protein LOC111714466 [Eurytemora carolleeae]|eukprot:XP_023345344.1 uncharacterized protein LOC111714466 [Eurytemora affinis]
MSITQGPKYMYERLVPKWKAWRLSEPEKYGKGFIGLLKNAYGEQPTVCLCMLLFGVGTVRMGWIYYENEKTGLYENRAYKKFYTVMRPDDERILKFRSEWFENGAPPTTVATKKM